MYWIICLSITDHDIFYHIFHNLFLIFHQSVSHKWLCHRTFKLSFDQLFLRIFQFSSYSTSFFESLNHFSSSFFNSWVFKHQPQHLFPNSLKRLLETNCVLLLSFRNLSIWIFDVQSNFVFLVIILKKICFKYKPQFLATNLQKFLVLSRLCLVWPILDPENILLLTLNVNKWMCLTDLKELLFGPCQPQKVEINFFSGYLVRITEGDNWVKFDLQRVKL